MRSKSWRGLTRKNVGRELATLTALAVGTLSGVLVRAQTAEVPRRSLAQFWELAAKESPQLAEQKGKVEFSQAREEFARSQGMPTGSVETLIAPMVGASGNALAGSTEWDKWGFLSSSKLQIAVPIYTFGALSGGREAARAGRQAEEKLLERDQWNLRTQVAELYYGYQLAFELSEVAESTQSDLEKALKKAERISARDADRLRVYLGEVKARLLEAKKGLEQTRLGMAWRTGLYGREVPRWDRANLVAREFQFSSLEDYKKMAGEGRPELTALSKDVEAKSALVRVEEGMSLPTLFAGGFFQYAVSPIREAQKSPFAYDPTNDMSGGLGLGLRWNLGVFERSAKRAQARAELHQAEARQRFFAAGIYADVERAYLDAKQTAEALVVRAEAAAAAKRVFRDLIVGYTLGTSNDAKPLFEALGQFVLAEKSRLESIFNANMGVVKLEQAVGRAL